MVSRKGAKTQRCRAVPQALESARQCRKRSGGIQKRLRPRHKFFAPLRLCVKPSLIFILDKYNHIGYTPQHLLTRRSKGSGAGKASPNLSFAPPRKGQSTRSAQVMALGAVKPKAKLKPRRKRQTGCLRRTLGPGSPPNLLAAIQGNSLSVPLARHDQPRGSSAVQRTHPAAVSRSPKGLPRVLRAGARGCKRISRPPPLARVFLAPAPTARSSCFPKALQSGLAAG